MKLSVAAKAFLEKQERRPFINDREMIEAALQKAKVPIFEPVVQFQLDYGGYTFYAGLEPMVYGIIHPTTRSDFRPLSIEAENDSDGWLIRCVDTLWQDYFHIDSFGRYYEGYEIIASSMDQFVEQFLVSEEMIAQGGWQVGYYRLKQPDKALAQLPHLGLEIIPGATDEYSTWWRSDLLTVHSTPSFITIWFRGDEGKRLATEVAILTAWKPKVW